MKLDRTAACHLNPQNSQLVRYIRWENVPCGPFSRLYKADIRAVRSILHFGLILLKNTCLIVGTATDSILSTTGRIGDDGTETGSAGGFVLRVLA